MEKVITHKPNERPMKGKIFLSLFAVSLLLMAIPMSMTDASISATTNYYVEGYVVEANSSDNIPLEGVIVTIMYPDGKLSSDESDSNGFFSVSVTTTIGLTISFTAYGLRMIACPHTTPIEDSDNYTLDLTIGNYNTETYHDYNSSTHTYTITGTADSTKAAFLIATIASLNGKVTYNDEQAVSGAKVKIVSTSTNKPYEGTTDESGQFKIKCPTGWYAVTVYCNGFDDSSTVTVNVTNDSTSILIPMYKSAVSQYFGFDLAHLLMLIGVCLGLILATTAWLISRRMKNNPKSTVVMDDDSSDESEIKFP